MKFRSHIFSGFILSVVLVLLLPAPSAAAQDNPDDKPHIQPRATPTPSPTPKGKDQYERPPFPGDAQKPGANEPPPRAGDEYERPPFPGDAPASQPSTTGESSSRDSQIDINARPAMAEPALAEEDESVLKPWDPHKAAKDVEVGEYYLKLKNYRAALERFNHALIYKANDAEATFGLAVTQEKLDLLGQADQNYHKYLSILPNGPKAKEAQAAIQRLAPQIARLKPAAGGGEDPVKVAAHDLNVGETYLSANNFDAARERFEEVLRLTPDNPLAYFRLAQSLQGMQRLDPARMNYRKYLELEPKGKFAKDARKAINEIGYVLGK
ncbi:MAG: tetratricopeptide repeat protein [Candidatus Angelobacter sp.]